MHFLLSLLQPHAVMCLFIAVACLFGYAYPGYMARTNGSFIWLLWLIVGVLAAIAWIILVIS